jgi:hypothetical protein
MRNVSRWLKVSLKSRSNPEVFHSRLFLRESEKEGEMGLYFDFQTNGLSLRPTRQERRARRDDHGRKLPRARLEKRISDR